MRSTGSGRAAGSDAGSPDPSVLAPPESKKHWAYALVPDSVVRRLYVPRGFLGRVSAVMMRRINREMNLAMVDHLALKGSERVLEIGFGPGEAVRLLGDALPHGAVAGVDPSTLMVALARRRNARLVHEGRADLREGVASALPWAAASFDCVCSANSVQLWGELGSPLAEVARVLVPEGRLVLSVHDWAAEGLEARIRAAIAEAPFRDVVVAPAVDTSGTTLHLVARRA